MRPAILLAILTGCIGDNPLYDPFWTIGPAVDPHPTVQDMAGSEVDAVRPADLARVPVDLVPPLDMTPQKLPGALCTNINSDCTGEACPWGECAQPTLPPGADRPGGNCEPDSVGTYRCCQSYQVFMGGLNPMIKSCTNCGTGWRCAVR